MGVNSGVAFSPCLQVSGNIQNPDQDNFRKLDPVCEIRQPSS